MCVCGSHLMHNRSQLSSHFVTSMSLHIVTNTAVMSCFCFCLLLACVYYCMWGMVMNECGYVWGWSQGRSQGFLLPPLGGPQELDSGCQAWTVSTFTC